MLPPETTRGNQLDRRHRGRLYGRWHSPSPRKIGRKQGRNDFADRDWGGWRCCQANANQSQFAPTHQISGCAELTPLGEGGGAVGRTSPTNALLATPPHRRVSGRKAVAHIPVHGSWRSWMILCMQAEPSLNWTKAACGRFFLSG